MTERIGAARTSIGLLLFFAILPLSGCGGLGDDKSEGPPPTWVGEVQPLVQANCAPCHTVPPQNGAPNAFRLDRYNRAEAGDTLDGAFEMRERIRARAVIEGSMPFGGPSLPEEQRTILRRWIDAGAPRGSAESTPTWTADIQPLLQSRCVPCHTSPPNNGAPSTFRFDRYNQDEAGGTLNGAFEMRERIRARAVVEGSMPYGGPPLPQEERTLLRRWIDAGAPRDAAASSANGVVEAIR